MNTTRIYENQKLVYFNIAHGIPRFTHGDAGHKPFLWISDEQRKSRICFRAVVVVFV